jgi:hypothetical protein
MTDQRLPEEAAGAIAPERLAIPIRVDALQLAARQTVARSMADFSRLPYVVQTDQITGYRNQPSQRPMIVNPDTAYLSEHVVVPAFDDDTLQLPPGIHLHWALPDSLTLGQHPVSAEGRVQTDQPIRFPAVPNRWLVIRSVAGTEQKRWVVESDYIGSQPASPAAITYPLRTKRKGPDGAEAELDAPFCYLGRARELSGPWQEPADGDYLAARHLATRHLPADRQELPPADLAYLVMGWYSHPQLDPLLERIASLTPAADARRGQTDYQRRRVRTALGLPLQDALDKAAQAGNDDRLKALLKELKEDFQWSIEPSPDDWDQVARLAGIVCVGEVRIGAPSAGDEEVADEPGADVQVAVGGSATEALSAFLAHAISREEYWPDAKRQYENQLEALHLSADLARHRVDLGPKFDEARHERTFTAVAGGSLWTLKKEPIEDVALGGPGNAVAAASLPRDLADAISVVQQQMAVACRSLTGLLAGDLHELNQWQLAYDRGHSILTGLRRQLFSDWYKYMVCNYHAPSGTRDNQTLSIDRMKRLVEIDVAWLRLAEALVGSTPDDVAANGPRLPLTSDNLSPDAAILDLGWQLCDRLASPTTSDGGGLNSWVDEQFVDWYKNRLTATPGGGPATISVRSDLLQAIAGRLLPIGSDLWPRFVDQGEMLVPWPTFGDQVAQSTGRLLQRLDGLAAARRTFLNGVRGPGGPVDVDLKDVALALLDVIGDRHELAPAIMDFLERFESLDDATRAIATAAVARAALNALPATQLRPTAAPRYYKPSDPVVLLAGRDVQATDRHGEDGQLAGWRLPGDPLNQLQSLVAQTRVLLEKWAVLRVLYRKAFEPDQLTADEQRELVREYLAERNETVAVAAHRLSVPDGGETDFFAAHREDIVQWAQDFDRSLATALRDSDGRAWHPLLLEWQALVAPAQAGGNVDPAARQYDPDFIGKNYTLDERRSEFARSKAAVSLSGSTSIVSGRTVLMPHARELLEQAIEEYLIAQARAYLHEHDGTLPGNPAPGSLQERAAWMQYFHDQHVAQWRNEQYQAKLAKGYLQTAAVSAEPSSPLGEAEAQRQYEVAHTGGGSQLKTDDDRLQYFLHHRERIVAWYNQRNGDRIQDTAPVMVALKAWDMIRKLHRDQGVAFQSQSAGRVRRSADDASPDAADAHSRSAVVSRVSAIYRTGGCPGRGPRKPNRSRTVLRFSSAAHWRDADPTLAIGRHLRPRAARAGVGSRCGGIARHYDRADESLGRRRRSLRRVAAADHPAGAGQLPLAERRRWFHGNGCRTARLTHLRLVAAQQPGRQPDGLRRRRRAGGLRRPGRPLAQPARPPRTGFSGRDLQRPPAPRRKMDL